MSLTKFKTIKLKNYSKVMEEYVAASAITPGMLVELNSQGKVQPHSGAGKTAAIMFAVEDELQGKGITEAYAAGDRVQVWIPNRGDMVYALLADESVVAIGDFVESNGNGFLRKRTRTSESWESVDNQPVQELYDHHLVGQAYEAKDLTSLSTAESTAFTDSGQPYVAIRVI